VHVIKGKGKRRKKGRGKDRIHFGKMKLHFSHPHPQRKKEGGEKKGLRQSLDDGAREYLKQSFFPFFAPLISGKGKKKEGEERSHDCGIDPMYFIGACNPAGEEKEEEEEGRNR